MARAGVDDRILDTALDILRTRGPASVSIESVSAASGIAKTTIYRRFDNRESLLAATLTVAGRPVEIPDGLDMRETPQARIGICGYNTIEHVIGRGTLAAVVGDGDTSTRALLLSVIREAIGPFRDLVRRGVASGDLRADLDIELVISVLTGAVVAEIIRGRPTDQRWVESLLGLLWPVLAGEDAQ